MGAAFRAGAKRATCDSAAIAEQAAPPARERARDRGSGKCTNSKRSLFMRERKQACQTANTCSAVALVLGFKLSMGARKSANSCACVVEIGRVGQRPLSTRPGRKHHTTSPKQTPRRDQ